MEFEWDEEKNGSNLEKHGIDFETAMLIWEGPVVEKVSNRRDYGENRFVVFGMVDNRVLAVVYTWRDNRCRIISARKANRNERRAYRETLARSRPDQGE